MIPSITYAIIDRNDNCLKSLDYISELKVDSAIYLISKEKKVKPNNIYTHYLEQYILFIEYFLNEDDEIYNKYSSNFELLIKKLEKEGATSLKNNLLSNLWFQNAIINFKKGNNLKSAINIINSYKYLMENVRNKQVIKEDKKLIAIYNLIFGSIPDEYSWLPNIIGLEGNISAGLNYLKYYYNNYESKYEKNESAIFYVFSQSIFSEQFANDINIKKSRLESNIVKLAYTFNLIHTGNAKEAIVLLKDVEESTKEKYPIFYYFEGVANLSLLENEGELYLKKFLIKYKGQNFIKSSNQKLFFYYLIENDYKNSIIYRNNTLQYGNSILAADKQAVFEVNRNDICVPFLKCRFLFDAGNYNSADSILSNDSIALFKYESNIPEYFYRKARISDKRNEVEKSIYYYNLVIENCKIDKHYYCANSLLLIGNIYEKNKNFDKALKSYKSVLLLDFNEYKSSIQHKAKSGINRINKQLKK